jgi:hypothetical protein
MDPSLGTKIAVAVGALALISGVVGTLKKWLTAAEQPG